VVPVLVVLFVIWTFVLSRTRYGRHISTLSVGTKRPPAGQVSRSTASASRIRDLLVHGGDRRYSDRLECVGGCRCANYGGNTLLLAVGAAVIGGTSLFGGKGRVLDALIGGAVVEVIYNGMADLVQGNNGSAIQYIVTGVVLLLAAAVDALSRRRAGATGLA